MSIIFLGEMDGGFLELIRASSQASIRKKTFTKSYFDLTEYHWNRIRNAAMLLSDHNIRPKVLRIDEDGDDNAITYEKVHPFSSNTPYTKDRDEIKVIRRKIEEKVKALHDLGYGHGDLNLENIGIRSDGSIVLLDPDTVYHINKDKNQQWLHDWIKIGHDSIDYDEFIEDSNYDSDWL